MRARAVKLDVVRNERPGVVRDVTWALTQPARLLRLR
jgi:hypothetical protein